MRGRRQPTLCRVYPPNISDPKLTSRALLLRNAIRELRHDCYKSTKSILRKEVIQPQVPLRLPCYDFTPVADPTVAACPPEGLAQRRRVEPTPMV